MDNIETTEPAGGEGATSSQDNSAIDTQPVESTDSVSDGGVVETEKAPTPWESDPRFKGKSDEERYKSYRELEGKLGQREENLAVVKDLEKATGMNAQQIKAALAQQQYEQQVQQYQENPVPFLAQEVMQLRQERLAEKQEQEINNFLNSDEGNPYQDLRQELLEDKQYNPRFQGTPIADIARERYGKAIATGQRGAYKKIETKQMTQATGVSTGEPKRKISTEDMQNMSTRELKAILPHA